MKQITSPLNVNQIIDKLKDDHTGDFDKILVKLFKVNITKNISNLLINLHIIIIFS